MAEVSLRTTLHTTCSTQQTWPLECTRRRQFAAQWGDCKKYRIAPNNNNDDDDDDDDNNNNNNNNDDDDDDDDDDNNSSYY